MERPSKIAVVVGSTAGWEGGACTGGREEGSIPSSGISLASSFGACCCCGWECATAAEVVSVPICDRLELAEVGGPPLDMGVYSVVSEGWTAKRKEVSQKLSYEKVSAILRGPEGVVRLTGRVAG